MSATAAGCNRAADQRAELGSARIEEARFIDLGGIEQWITIRGDRADSPVLMLVHGGPGDAQSSLVSTYAPYEGDFVLVQWDQRGAGRTWIQKGQVTVIDVNSRESWVETRVPGAVNLDPEAYDERRLPADRDATVVFYCSNSMCRKGPNAARRARKMGYGNAIVMSAGIRGWLSSRLPVERGK